MITSTETDPRVAEILLHNHIPANASVLNTNRYTPTTTEKYSETDDVGIIQALNEAGWFISSYQEVKTRGGRRQGFQKYLATYQSSKYVKGNDGTLQLLQKGSHDGSAPLLMLGGYLKFACGNGLIIGDFVFEPIKVKHIGHVPSLVVEAADKLGEVCPAVFDTIDRMAQKTLSEAQKVSFAQAAVNLRFGDNKSSVVPLNFLNARRVEDNSPTLWNVFNVVQENIFNPPADLKAVTKTGKIRKIRAINNIDVKVNLNKGLWDLAQSYLVQ